MHLWPFNHHLFRFTSHVGTKSAVGTWITSWHTICVCCAFLRWFFVRISALWSCGSCKPLPGLSGIATNQLCSSFWTSPSFLFCRVSVEAWRNLHILYLYIVQPLAMSLRVKYTPCTCADLVIFTCLVAGNKSKLLSPLAWRYCPSNIIDMCSCGVLDST